MTTDQPTDGLDPFEELHDRTDPADLARRVEALHAAGRDTEALEAQLALTTWERTERQRLEADVRRLTTERDRAHRALTRLAEGTRSRRLTLDGVHLIAAEALDRAATGEPDLTERLVRERDDARRIARDQVTRADTAERERDDARAALRKIRELINCNTDIVTASGRAEVIRQLDNLARRALGDD